jgi:hypothetical protein
MWTSVEGLNALMSEVGFDEATSHTVIKEQARKAVTIEDRPSRKAVANVSWYGLSIVPELDEDLGNRPTRSSGNLRLRLLFLYKASYVP